MLVIIYISLDDVEGDEIIEIILMNGIKDFNMAHINVAELG